jgi:hypothetical protein
MPRSWDHRHVGGQHSSGNFANDRERAAEAGRKGEEFPLRDQDYWSRKRRIIGKAEVTGDKAKPRSTRIY